MAKANETTQSSQYHLYYLPYLRLKEEIRIGEFVFWPFYKQHEKRIEDVYVLAETKTFLDKYVDIRGKPLQAVTIIEKERAQFSKIGSMTVDRMRSALDILAFGILSRNSVQKAVVSELFDFHEYVFRAGDTKATTLR